MRYLIILGIFLISSPKSFGNGKISFTNEDRDRIIILNEKMNSLDEKLKSTNEKFVATNEKINSLEKLFDTKLNAQSDKLGTLTTFMYFVLGAIASLIGFILWDRRTALSPIEQDTRELKKENKEIISTLKDIVQNDSQLVDVLRSLVNPGNSTYEYDIKDYQVNVDELLNSPIFRQVSNG